MFVYIALGIFAMTVFLCNVVGKFIQTTALDLNHWLIVAALAFMIIPADLIRKLLVNINKKGDK